MRVTCSIQAAARFELPADLMLAVSETEGGRVGQWVRNTNGSYDVGPMQFNTTYLTYLERFGITPKDVAADGCYPYELAAWRLRRHLGRDDGDVWTRAANYHSRTPIHNARYRTAIRARATKWARWLSAHAPSTKIVALDAASVTNQSRSHTEQTPRASHKRQTVHSAQLKHCAATRQSRATVDGATCTLGVHDGDLTVHDAAISACTITRRIHAGSVHARLSRCHKGMPRSRADNRME